MTPDQEARTLWLFHLVFGGAFIGAAVAVVQSGKVKVSLGSARSGWQAARSRSQRMFPGKRFKPGPWDDWTNEELIVKVRDLLLGPKAIFDEGAWYDLDRAWSELVSARPNCEKAYNHFSAGIGKMRTVKSIHGTGRLSSPSGRIDIDWVAIDQRIAEVTDAYRRTCHRGPELPVL
jgi:hypothetical protein